MPVIALLPYLALRGSHPGPLFIMEDHTYLTQVTLQPSYRRYLRQLVLTTQYTPAIASEVVLQLLQLKPIFQMCISKCWVDGKVKHIKCMSSQLQKKLAKASKQLSAAVKSRSSLSPSDS